MNGDATKKKTMHIYKNVLKITYIHIIYRTNGNYRPKNYNKKMESSLHGLKS